MVLWSRSRKFDESVKTKLPINKIRSLVLCLFCSYYYKKNNLDFIGILWTCAFYCTYCFYFFYCKRPNVKVELQDETRLHSVIIGCFHVFAVDLHSSSLIFFSSSPCLWLIDTSGMMGHHSARAGLAAQSCDRSRWHSWVLERVHLLFALLLPALLLSNTTKGEQKRRVEMKEKGGRRRKKRVGRHEDRFQGENGWEGAKWMRRDGKMEMR